MDARHSLEAEATLSVSSGLGYVNKRQFASHALGRDRPESRKGYALLQNPRLTASGGCGNQCFHRCIAGAVIIAGI